MYVHIRRHHIQDTHNVGCRTNSTLLKCLFNSVLGNSWIVKWWCCVAVLPEGGLQDAAAGPGAGQQGELLLRGEAGAGRLHGAGTHHPSSPALVTASVLGTTPPGPAPARATLMVFIVGLDTVCPPPHVTAAPRSSPKLYFIELFTRVYPCTRCRSVSGPACSATPTPSTWTSRRPPTCTTSKHTEYL